jgi:hypothetical protein
MVVIDCKVLEAAARVTTRTDRTLAVLGLEHALVVFNRDAVIAAVVATSHRLGPLDRVASGTRRPTSRIASFAMPVPTVTTILVAEELFNWFGSQTAAADFHLRGSGGLGV